MSNNYSPQSHFFVEDININNALDSNYELDAFGPVKNNLATQYRTTSIIRADSITKVFAICKGRILIQPTTDDDTKVNLILKPHAIYTPLKIKYFIYRGINKSDLIIEESLKPKDLNDANQPSFLRNIWDAYISLNLSSPNSPQPTVLPPNIIGYYPLNQPPESLIETYFNKGYDNYYSYELPVCREGDHIGNFTGQLGLDIVLDYGDYQIDSQNELFKLDLTYARKLSHSLDISALLTPTAVKEKRYKEYIHLFMDPAAFWGSHIECGNIKLFNNKSGIKTQSDIYTHILRKYQTRNNVYIYIRGERGKSYNYINSARKISFEIYSNPSQPSIPNESYNTSDWPILIREFINTNGGSRYVRCVMQYDIATATPLIDRHISIDICAPDNDVSSFPKEYKPKTTGIASTEPFDFKIYFNPTISCATFLIINCNLTQTLPQSKYYDNLWPFNIQPTIPKTSIGSNLSWCTYDKSRMLRLSHTFDIGASIQNKVLFDQGKNIINNTAKNRRLFIAAIKRSTNHELEYNQLNISDFLQGQKSTPTTSEEYSLLGYNDKDISIYQGVVTEGNDQIFTLSLVHDAQFEKRNSYFQLGITDDEYNKLLYGTVSVPTSGSLLPPDTGEVYIELRETSGNVIKDFKKFKVGLNYENSLGVYESTLDQNTPTPGNDVFVYTVDGFYFFSKEFSDHQTFYQQFAKASVEFRTKISNNPYKGEFGFDWLRVGDNGDRAYEIIVEGGYERPSNGDLNTEFENPDEAYKALKSEYRSLPTQKVDTQYYVPYLNLFSQTFSNTIVTSPKPPFEAELRVLVEINEALSKLEFDYDHLYFDIDKPILSDKSIRTKGDSIDKTIKITCKQDFSINKEIKILAYPLNSNNKKDAKVAGMVTLRRNGVLNRKTLNTVLIKVRTNISGVVEEGIFSNNEKDNLRISHYQALIHGRTEFETLDLLNDQNFKSGGLYIDSNMTINYLEPTLYTYLKSKLNVKYNTYIKIFSFYVEATYNSGGVIAGRSEGFGTDSVILYKSKNDLTACHEVFHSLGLHHSHRDGVIRFPEQKYIYPKYTSNVNTSTDNYMSYADIYRKSLWDWQLKIIHFYIK